MSDSSKKDIRRQKMAQNSTKKEQISEEQKFVSRSKKQFKKQIEDMKADELWEDWENEIH